MRSIERQGDRVGGRQREGGPQGSMSIVQPQVGKGDLFISSFISLSASLIAGLAFCRRLPFISSSHKVRIMLHNETPPTHRC